MRSSNFELSAFEGVVYICLKAIILIETYSRIPRLPDNNQERRPIIIELNLNAVALWDGESLPVSSLTFDLASSKTPLTIRASPSKRRKDSNRIWLLKIPPSTQD